jgi:hypothetical protein
MDEQNLTLLDAITTAKENELRASHTYLDAAMKTNNPRGVELFTGLADFEREHYEALIKLENALRERRVFRGYKVMNIPLAGWKFDNKEVDPEGLELIGIIDFAMQRENQAAEAYARLAELATDEKVCDLFTKLAAEERFHYRVLHAARTSLRTTGTWDFQLDSLNHFP